MANTNLSEVWLLAVPLENDYQHTLYFENAAKQAAYFKDQIKHVQVGCSYIRKDKVIKYPKHYDELIGVNYVMFRNDYYNNKWFYCFITKMEYVNDGMTNIYIETDVLQTWAFDYNVKASFVEREHTDNDAVGANTVPENLQLGEYVSNRHNKDDDLKDNHKFVLASTVAMDGTSEDYSGGETMEIFGGMYGGIYTGVRYYTYETSETMTPQTPLSNIIHGIVSGSGMEAIQCLFMAPEFLCTNKSGQVVKNNEIPCSSNHKYYDHTEEKPFNNYGLDGYWATNNKLYTFPYCYLHVDNGNGANAIYHYEYFQNDTMQFHVEGVLCPGCSIRMVPLNYKGSNYADREGLNLGKFPICNWASDLYTNWVTQNGVNVATNIASGAASMIGGAVSGAMMGGAGGAVAGAVVGGLSGFSQIANTLQSVKNADMVPPQTAGNINCGDVITAANNNTFHYYHMSIKAEFARIIDEYFDMYGYATHRVKVPNKNHRRSYWYTKTINANIDGAIPMEDIQKIKACYNNGVTFWKSPADIQDYTVANGIIS